MVFAVYQSAKTPIPYYLYLALARSFGKTLERINKGDKEDGSNERRRKITLHSFRRFVKTTISDLGYSDYSEWLIGWQIHTIIQRYRIATSMSIKYEERKEA